MREESFHINNLNYYTPYNTNIQKRNDKSKSRERAEILHDASGAAAAHGILPSYLQISPQYNVFFVGIIALPKASLWSFGLFVYSTIY